MIRNKYNFIVVVVLLLSFSTHPVNAQFFKKKKHVESAADTSVVGNDSLGSAKEKPVAVKDTTAALKHVAPKKIIPPAHSVQDTAFNPGDNQLSLGYGFFPLDGDVIKWVYHTKGTSSNFFGPIYLKYEHAFDYNWTIGLNLAYGHYNITTTNTYTTPEKYLSYVPPPGGYQEHRSDNTFSALVRVNYHFAMMNKFDPYIGFGIGYRSSSSSYNTNDPDGVAPESYDNRFPAGFETTAGVRYVMSDNTCLYAEFGLAKSLLQVGLTYKMKTNPDVKKSRR